MKKVKVWVSTKKVGSRCDDSFEIEDNATEEEIEELAEEVMWEMVDWNWSVEE